MPPTTGYSFGELVLEPSAIKPVITTIEQALVLRKLGELMDEDREALRVAIAGIVG